MFIGHYGLALASKRVAPKASLGMLILAAQFLDLIWPIFVLFGWEKVRIDPWNTAFTPLEFVYYPVSHSLFMAIVWSLLVCFVFLAKSEDLKAAGIIFVLVTSHWILDMIVHRPDLPILWGEEVYAGLGLWNSVWGTITVELGLFAAGLFIYLKTTKAADKTGKFALWGMCAFLLLAWLGAAFGPTPPSEKIVAVAALLLWGLVFWGNWIDRHRVAVNKG